MSQNNGNNTNFSPSQDRPCRDAQRRRHMDVTNARQAEIAEKAGAVSVMALERVPAQIRAEGGVARMARPKRFARSWPPCPFRSWPNAASDTLPKHRSCRNSESTTSTNRKYSRLLTRPIMSKACVQRSVRLWRPQFRRSPSPHRRRGGHDPHQGRSGHRRRRPRRQAHPPDCSGDEDPHGAGRGRIYAKAKEHQAPYELVKMVAKAGKLPVPNFSAGGIATPADARLVMQSEPKQFS